MTNSENSLEDSGIAFDADSGISEDEQREILSKINSIAERNRLSLTGAGEDPAGEDPPGKANGRFAVFGKGSDWRFKAKKSGARFPVLVNIAAVAVLAGGIFSLSAVQWKTDAQVREGAKVYNSAERALIDEIRKETSSRLEAKENEISMYSLKLEDVDAELRELHSSNLELTAEQQETENKLKSVQDEYRSALAQLQDERSLILEEARAKEAGLQAQLEKRTRELALVAEHGAAAINLARNELDRLSREQAAASTVEAQMGALFANLNGQLAQNRLDDAAGTVNSMREFLDTPAFLSLRSIQARRELYTQAINSFGTMIDEARKNQAGGPAPQDGADKILADLQEKNAKLESDLAEKDKTIEAFSSEGSGMTQRLNELNNSVSALRTANSALEAGSSAKDEKITSLESDLAAQTQNAEASQQMADTLQTQVASLNQLVSSRDTTIQTLEQQSSAMEETITNLNTQLAQIRQALQALSQ